MVIVVCSKWLLSREACTSRRLPTPLAQLPTAPKLGRLPPVPCPSPLVSASRFLADFCAQRRLSPCRSVPAHRYPVFVSLVYFLGPSNCIVSPSLSQWRPHHRKRSQRLRKSPQEQTRRPRSSRGSPTQHDSWVQVRAAAQMPMASSDQRQDVRVVPSSWSSTPSIPQPSVS